MSLIAMPRRTDPSWKAGFARSASQSANPGLWKGLVGMWIPGLGPTGSTLFDVSGFHNQGILTNMNGTDWVVSEKGWALDFNSSYVDLDDAFFAIPERSVSLWFRADALQAAMVFAGGTSSPNRWYMWPQSDGTIDTQIGGEGAVTSSIGYVANTWTHYVVTYDGVRAKAYVDGREGSDQANSSLSGSQDVNIGSFAEGSLTWNGQIDNVSVYNRALRPNEIQQLFQDPVAPLRLRLRVFAATVVAPPAGGGVNHVIGGGIII